MIQLSTIPQFVKAHNKHPDRAGICLAMIMVRPIFLKICTFDSSDPYPFQQGKVKYSNYVCANVGKGRVAMPKESLFALYEMVKAGVQGRILADYIFNNLYFTTND